MSDEEIQKELEKANQYLSTNNYAKAAKSLHNVAKATDGEKRIEFYEEAFLASIKTDEINLKYELSMYFFQALRNWNKNEIIDDYYNDFVEISEKKIESSEKESIKQIEVLDWIMELSKYKNDSAKAFEISQQKGDIYKKVGTELLQTQHLLGKEEKFNQGLEYLGEAISSYQEISVNIDTIQRIIDVIILKINLLIDIGRLEDALKQKNKLITFYNAVEKSKVPFSLNDLYDKLGTLFAQKTIIELRKKHFSQSEILEKETIECYTNANEEKLIPSFLWSKVMLLDELEVRDNFHSLIEDTFQMAINQNLDDLQNSIIEYLNARGFDECNDIVNSRMLKVRKGPIEFQNNEGLRYLDRSILLSKLIKNTETIDHILKFVVAYAQTMYSKNLRLQSLPYFVYVGEIWKDIDGRENEIRSLIEYINIHFGSLMTEGKLSDAAPHLTSIIELKMMVNDIEEAGVLSFNFAKAAAQSDKIFLEIDFVEKAYESFTMLKATEKLEELFLFIIERSDPLFINSSKIEENRSKYLHLGTITSQGISEQKHAHFLKTTSIKALKSELIPLANEYVEKAFESLKNINEEEAADHLFLFGSEMFSIDKEKAIDYIGRSTSFAMNYEPLKHTIERNLTFIMEKILDSVGLEEKMFLIKNLEEICTVVERKDLYEEFLFSFVKNLSEKAYDTAYFGQMKKYLEVTFDDYYKKQKNHPQIQILIDWISSFITSLSAEKQRFDQLFELTVVNLTFHEKTNQIEKFLEFYWPIYNSLCMSEDFARAMDLYYHTYERLSGKEKQLEFTQKSMSNIDRSVKSLIVEEKFTEAWPIIEKLYSILIKTNKEESIKLYENYGSLFYKHRLDLTLTMWANISESMHGSEEYQSLLNIIKNIDEEIMPYYKEKNQPPAVNQLYNQKIILYRQMNKIEESAEQHQECAKYNLTLQRMDDFLEWSIRGCKFSIENDLSKTLFEIADMNYAIAKNLLKENSEFSINLINTTSELLIGYSEEGRTYYYKKIGEHYEELYLNPATQEFATTEREKLITHFKEHSLKNEEAKFLVTTGKISLQMGKISEGMGLLKQATKIFEEQDNNDGLSDIVRVCLKTATKFQYDSTEYNLLSNHASKIQEKVPIDEEKTQDALGDVFDNILDDMMTFMDPDERKKKKKKK